MGSSSTFNSLGSVTVALSSRKVRPSGGGMQLPFGQPELLGCGVLVGEAVGEVEFVAFVEVVV